MKVVLGQPERERERERDERRGGGGQRNALRKVTKIDNRTEGNRKRVERRRADSDKKHAEEETNDTCVYMSPIHTIYSALR